MGGIYWLASYPKSGNTWLRAFLRNLQDDDEAPVSLDDLATGGIASARGWIDELLGFDTADLAPEEVERLRPGVYRWSLRDVDIGYHKIHDAYTYTEDGEPLVSREATMGAVYILRNPLDVAPSAANHWDCSVDQAIERMANPEMSLCEFRNSLPGQVQQRLLSWSDHVRSWVYAAELNRLTIRYEDMLARPQETFGRVAAFLGLSGDALRIGKAIRNSEFRELVRQETEKGFRERPQHTRRFFRRGRNGDWRESLSPEQVRRIVADHGEIMGLFGYLDEQGKPV